MLMSNVNCFADLGKKHESIANTQLSAIAILINRLADYILGGDINLSI